jgi:hypothetical protein
MRARATAVAAVKLSALRADVEVAAVSLVSAGFEGVGIVSAVTYDRLATRADGDGANEHGYSPR